MTQTTFTTSELQKMALTYWHYGAFSDDFVYGEVVDDNNNIQLIVDFHVPNVDDVQVWDMYISGNDSVTICVPEINETNVRLGLDAVFPNRPITIKENK